MAPSLDLFALAALVPASVVRWRRNDARDALFYAVLVLAVIGPAVLVAARLGGAWHAGFAMSLWLSIAATMALFLALAALTRQAWRLTLLLVPFLLLLGLIAALWEKAPAHPIVGNVPAAWLDFHIVSAVATYGLLTIAAVAGMAVFVQERALKAKHQTALTRLLPAVSDSEALEVGLLVAAEAVLALGGRARHGGRAFPSRGAAAVRPQDGSVAGRFCRHRRAAGGAAGQWAARSGGGAMGVARVSPADPGLSRREIRYRRAHGVTSQILVALQQWADTTLFRI